MRARQGRGGGLEFHIDLLPPATLAAYVAKHVGAVDLKTAEAAEAARDEAQRQLTLPAVESRDARLALLAAADRLARDGNMSRNLADRAFVALYHMGKIEVAPWVRQAVPMVTPRTLRRWRTLKWRDGISRLDALIEGALKEKKILPAEKDHYVSLCATDAGFESVKALLAAKSPALGKSGLDEKKEPAAGAPLTATQLMAKANKMVADGEATDYLAAIALLSAEADRAAA